MLLVNIVILAALVFLLLFEEIRHRRFFRRVQETRQYLNALSDRLRTPLVNMRKYNAFLRSKEGGKLTIAQIEILSKMDGAASETIVLFNRLLAASRLERDAFVDELAKIDLRDSVQAAINAVSGVFAEKQHELSYEPGWKPMTIEAEPVLLHGIFDEILLNAAAYTPKGGKISVRVREKEKGNAVMVEVKDNGIGISSDERPRIFEKFYRGEQARKMYDGNGLGLFFAKSFAEQCKGSIRLISSKRKGSTFTVTLPLKKRVKNA